jgi:hypothetical protein
MKTQAAPIILCLTLLSAPSLAQDRSEETSTRVPALEQFHSVVAQIWHTAWPEKNAGMLLDLLPEVEKGVASITAAVLPGILREKEAAWKSGVAKLQTSLTHYQAAAREKSTEKLLDAAEELHRHYEALVRTIRPVMSEVEDFHATLYLLYHYYGPENDLPKIGEAARALEEKMTRLERATLPARLAKKAKPFSRAREELAEAVHHLQQILQSTSDTPARSEIEAAVDQVHSHYETLLGILE